MVLWMALAVEKTRPSTCTLTMLFPSQHSTPPACPPAPVAHDNTQLHMLLQHRCSCLFASIGSGRKTTMRRLTAAVRDHCL